VVHQSESDALIHDLAGDPADRRILAVLPRPGFDHHLDPFGKQRPDQTVHAVTRVEVGRIVEADGVDSCVDERPDVKADDASISGAARSSNQPCQLPSLVTMRTSGTRWNP
jgi:hypothetical protein